MSFLKKLFQSDKAKLGIQKKIYHVPIPTEQIYQKGVQFFNQKEYKKAFIKFKEAYALEHDGACQHLAEMYRLGLYVEMDLNQSVEYLKVGAQREVAESQYNLGYSYFQGHVVNKDLDKAIYWYKKSAKNDFFVAQFQLAICYLTGTGVELDKEQAKRWLKVSKSNGHPQAEEVLAGL